MAKHTLMRILGSARTPEPQFVIAQVCMDCQCVVSSRLLDVDNICIESEAQFCAMWTSADDEQWLNHLGGYKVAHA